MEAQREEDKAERAGDNKAEARGVKRRGPRRQPTKKEKEKEGTRREKEKQKGRGERERDVSRASLEELVARSRPQKRSPQKKHSWVHAPLFFHLVPYCGQTLVWHGSPGFCQCLEI